MELTRIAHNYVSSLTPEMVIPHHQDNFFPPISTRVNSLPLVNQVKNSHPDIPVRTLEINETIEI